MRALPTGGEHAAAAFAVALGEHRREGADLPGEGIEFGAMRADGLEPALFGLGESLRAAEDPLVEAAGDPPEVPGGG
ncbi:hypothetical protein ACWDA7_21410 [Streptomyces sp. NPDC001156]